MGKKFAMFGGVGGQNSPFSPGSSPLFNGHGGSGYGVDNFGSDASLDALMARSHKPYVLGNFERPIESLLETFHDDLENDAEGYLLDFDERLKLDKKKKIRNKEQYLKSLRDKEEANEKTEQIITRLKTVERLLDEFRKNDGIDFTKNASVKLAAMDIDEIPMEHNFEKLHKNEDSFYRTKGSPPLMDKFLPTVNEYKAEGNPLNLTNNRLTEPFTGIAPHYTPEDGLDAYIKQLNNPQNIDMHANFEGLMTTENPQENTTHSVQGTLFDEPSPITPESKKQNITLEEKLEKMKQQGGWDPNRLDPDMFTALDWDNKSKGTWKERTKTNQTPYQGDTLGNLEQPEEIGQFTSNYPYNQSAGLMR